jgi:hypothetical protein
MREFPGFLNVLQKQLESLDVSTLERVNVDGGLEVSELINRVLKPVDYTVDQPYFVEEVVKCVPDIDHDDFWRGKDSLNSGETVLCISTDDKSFEVDNKTGFTHLEQQLVKSSWVKRVWIFVEPSHKKFVNESLKRTGSRAFVLQGYESFCLTPNNELVIKEGQPVFHGCGTGDLIFASKRQSLLQLHLVGGGKYIYVIPCKPGVELQPILVGMHTRLNKPVTWQVTERSLDSEYGILCEHAGFPQIVEKFRLSSQTADDLYEYNSVDSCVFDASLDFDSVPWKWHRMKVKTGKGLSVQFKRTLYDLTANFQTVFVDLQLK